MFAFTPMSPFSLSPFGIHPSCTLVPPSSPHLHTCDDWSGFSAESYVRHRGVFHPGSESGHGASSLCPISVARSSLAAPGRCGDLSCPPRRAPLPSSFSARRAVPDLGLGMGLSLQLSPPSAGGPVPCADSQAQLMFITAWFVVFRQRIDSLSKQRPCWSSCSLSAVAASARASLSAACKTIARQTPRVCCQYATPLYDSISFHLSSGQALFLFM